MGNEKDFAFGIRIQGFEDFETVKNSVAGFAEEVEGGGGEKSEEGETCRGESWGHGWN